MIDSDREHLGGTAPLRLLAASIARRARWRELLAQGAEITRCPTCGDPVLSTPGAVCVVHLCSELPT